MKVKKRYSGVLKRLVRELILKKMVWGNGLGYYVYISDQHGRPPLHIKRSCLASVYYKKYEYTYCKVYSYYKEAYDRYLKILFDLGLKDRIDEIFYGQETI